jgi:geranylgeranyl pyrophosphate synthase
MTSQTTDTAEPTRSRPPDPSQSPSLSPSATTRLLAPVLDDLAVADAAIRGVADTENPLLSQTLRMILTVSGKRLRPALTLLAAGMHETALQRRVELAMAAELLHTATLIHDDVIDVSAARRGRPTINAAFSNTLAVLTGDYLFGKSGELISGLGSTAIMGVYSWAVMELVQGEMFRPTLDGDLDATERDYLAKIRGKTASLFAMCTQTGAMLDADDPDAVGRLRDYGLNLGMAFQVVDDVLDYTASEAELGKPVGSDLRHGTITLPAICYLRQHPQDALVRGLLDQDEDAQSEADAAVETIRRSGATEQALDRARTYATAATAALDGLPAGPTVESLYGLARYVVDRKE